MAAKNGRSLGDIFSSTTPKASKEKSPAAAAEEDMVKASTYFTQDQLDYLDEQSREIRRNTKVMMKRTTILRAIVQGFMEEQVNLGAHATEAALAAAVRKRMPLKGGRI